MYNGSISENKKIQIRYKKERNVTEVHKKCRMNGRNIKFLDGKTQYHINHSKTCMILSSFPMSILKPSNNVRK
jgi:hypothetical protein